MSKSRMITHVNFCQFLHELFLLLLFSQPTTAFTSTLAACAVAVNIHPILVVTHITAYLFPKLQVRYLLLLNALHKPTKNKMFYII